MVSEIWSVTDRSFCHFGPFFALLLPQQCEKSKFWKIEKNSWRYYHFTNVYHKWKSYDIKCDRQNLSFWTIFCPLTPLTTWKIKKLKNWKKSLEIYHFTQVYLKWQSYDVWFLRYEAWRTKFFCHFGPFFALLPL